MPVEIKISGENAAQAIAELRDLSAPFTSPWGHFANLGPAQHEPQSGSPYIADGELTEPAKNDAQLDIEDAIAAKSEEKPKRTRRTKAEMEAARAAEAAPAPAAEPAPAIEPESPEVQAQDAADEAPEPSAELTHDDVRAVLKKYVEKYGLPATQEDGPKVLQMLFGEGKTKISDVPATQESLRKTIDGLEEMLVKNPFKREAV